MTPETKRTLAKEEARYLANRTRGIRVNVAIDQMPVGTRYLRWCVTCKQPAEICDVEGNHR